MDQGLELRPTGVFYRFIQALTGIVVLACVVAGYLGLRALVWRHDGELAVQLTSGLILAGIVGGVLGLLYLIFGAQSIRFVLRFDWTSVQFGMVVGVLLYGGYNAVTPLLFTYADEPGLIRALQGAVDGILIGLFLGFLIGLINTQPMRLNRQGITRFIALYMLVLVALSILIFIGTQPGIPRNLPFWLLIPMVLALRFGVGLYDGREKRKSRE